MGLALEQAKLALEADEVPVGAIIVDAGACEALQGKKRSLLASGIVRIRGEFKAGEAVELETAEGLVFGRGLTRYSSAELTRIAGKKSSEIESVLGYKYRDEVIHRSDLILWS